MQAMRSPEPLADFALLTRLAGRNAYRCELPRLRQTGRRTTRVITNQTEMATSKSSGKKAKAKGKQTSTRTIYYKRALFIPAETVGETLGDLLDRALSKRNRPSRRMEKLGTSSDNIRAIDKCFTHNGLICGRFFDYTEGGAQAVLQIDEDAEEFGIKSIPPGKKEQFLRGMLTFGIQGNLMMLIQSNALKHGHLENHLNWLLRQSAEVLSSQARLNISDQPSPLLTRQLENVNSIVLKEGVSTGTLILEAEETPKDTLAPVIAALQQMVPKARDIFGDRLTPEQALALEELNIELKISRVRKAGSVSAFDQIANALRRLEDVKVVVRARGEILDTDDLRLSVQRSVEVDGNEMPDLKDVARVMQDWLSYLLSRDRVPG